MQCEKNFLRFQIAKIGSLVMLQLEPNVTFLYLKVFCHLYFFFSLSLFCICSYAWLLESTWCSSYGTLSWGYQHNINYNKGQNGRCGLFQLQAWGGLNFSSTKDQGQDQNILIFFQLKFSWEISTNSWKCQRYSVI